MRFAVVGHPVAHSLSPAMHRAAYADLGLAEEHTYEAVEVDDDGLADFLAGLDDTWRGLSLTMPLKRRAVPLMDSLDAWAALSGAVNTVLRTEDRVLGFNTDVPGAVTALRTQVSDPIGEVAVLGGGATATSTLLAAVELGCRQATLVVRDPDRAEHTVRVVRSHHDAPEVGVALLSEVVTRGGLDADVLVSTVPAQAQTEDLLAAVADVPVVFDVVYDPWPTPLVEAARRSGRAHVTGLDLLAQQAVLQLQVMIGDAVPAARLVEAALRELRAGGRASDEAVASPPVSDPAS